MPQRRRVLILGSTGSIGRSALDVIAALPHELEVVGIAAGERYEALAEQAARFHVRHVAIANTAHYGSLRQECAHGTAVYAGPEGLVEIVHGVAADFVLSAIVGAAGLPPTLAAVERGLDVGIANKESLAVGGSVLMPLAAKTGSRLIPVDSEHSAIFQCLHAGHREDLRRIYLTASGGPFRDWPLEKIAGATLADALRHPVWRMGPKVTIDSATMMNKALEVIEAHHLFGLAADQIEILIHPESIVHSMVEFCDGSIVAQLSTPDMRIPIQYAMTYPYRRPGPAQALRWTDAQQLRFEPPDFERFPALRMGFETARSGGSSGAVFNAANEAAVDAFRSGRIRFGQICTLIERTLSRHRTEREPTIHDLLRVDAWARQEVLGCI